MTTQAYLVHGWHVSITAEDVILTALRARLGRFPPGDPAAGSRLQFDFHRVAAASHPGVRRPSGRARVLREMPSEEELVYFAEAEQLYLGLGGRGRALCDLQTGHVQVSYPESALADLPRLCRPLFTIPLVELLKRRALYSVHAGGVALKGRGLLLVGVGGTGKTTLTVSLVRAGFDFLGDDTLFVAAGPGGWRVLAFPDELAVTAQTAGFFPELRNPAWEPARPGLKHPLCASATYGVKPCWECMPRALVFPQIAARPRSVVTPLAGRGGLGQADREQSAPDGSPLVASALGRFGGAGPAMPVLSPGNRPRLRATAKPPATAAGLGRPLPCPASGGRDDVMRPCPATSEPPRLSRDSRFAHFLEANRAIRLELNVDATTRCQLGCAYCYFGPKGGRTMNVNTLFAALRNLSGVFGSRLAEVRLKFMGGEPLLAWPEILALTGLARPYFETNGVKFSWAVISNLIALDEAIAARMIRERADIQCSLDGPADLQNRHRPYADGGASFPDVLRRVPLALAINPKAVARVTICPAEAGRLLEITDFLSALGFRSVTLVHAGNQAWSKAALGHWGRSLGEVVAKYGPAESRVRVSCVLPVSRNELPGAFSYCGAGTSLFALGVDGHLFFCHRMTQRPDRAVIDASQAGPDQILKAIVGSRLPPRQSAALPPGCGDCPALNRCNGGCWNQNLLTHGHSEVPCPTECAIRRVTARAIGPIWDALHRERQTARAILQNGMGRSLVGG